MKRFTLYIAWFAVGLVLLFYSLNYQGGEEAMLAQVESEVMAVSYQKAVLVKNIYVTPGQVVDSGDLLIKVERPDLELDLDKKITEKNHTEKRIVEADEIYRNALNLLTTEYKRKKTLLLSEKDELEYELKLINERKRKLDSISNIPFITGDSLLKKQIELVDSQLKSLDDEFSLEKRKLQNTLENDTFHLKSELLIIEQEIVDLENENKQLLRKAEKKGTIGNLYVQLNELAPPYKTLLSVYDINPTLIKAFVHEKGVQNLKIGSTVMVESINREYSIEGQIIEIGSRVTAYPDKINPLMNQKSYGQEIFINIPDENDFLNGEKVYVYNIEDES